MSEHAEDRADVAVVGLGAIGLPMAVNLASSGLRTQVWNRTAHKADRAVAAGAHAVEDIAHVNASIVLSVLTDTPQLWEVLKAGLESTLRSGDIVAVMSTSSPAAVRELGMHLATRGVMVIDAPVSGGDVGAWAGTLSIMVGGDDDAVARCNAALNVVGGTVVHLGPLGSGQIAKLANQIVVAGTLAALGEALNLAEAAGLNTQSVAEALGAGLAGSRALEVKGPKLLSGDFAPGGAAVHHLKDLRYAVAAAREVNMPHPLTTELTREYEELVARGFGDLDQSAIALLSKPATQGESP